MGYKIISKSSQKSKIIEKNLDRFLKLMGDLASLNINVSDEDHAIQILTSLQSQYVFQTLKRIRKDTLTVRDVTTSSYAKEIELK